MGESGGDRAAKPAAAAAGARRYQEKLRRYQQKLEQRPQVAFLLQANRRFKEIEGKHLALVISVNLFVAVIPLLIIIYAFAEAFSPHRSFGALVVRDLHLTGSSALIVRDTFTSGGFGVSLALIAAVGIIASFWVWIAAVMGVYWEHKAGPAAVAAMEELSAEISGAEQSSVSAKPAS